MRRHLNGKLYHNKWEEKERTNRIIQYETCMVSFNRASVIHIAYTRKIPPYINLIIDSQ